MKKIINMMCVVMMLFGVAIISVSAAELSECYYSFDDGISTVKLSGTVSEEYKNIPVTVLLTQNDNSSADENIRHITQATVDSEKNWTASFSVKEDIAGYNIKIRHNNAIVMPSLRQVILAPDESGESLYTDTEAKLISNGNIRVSAQLKKPEGLSEAVAIIAVKDFKGTLVSVKFKTIDFTNVNTAPIEEVFVLKDPSRDVYVELFCFENLTNIRPLTAKKKLPVSMTVTYDENPEPIMKNPGKGFVRYGNSNTFSGSDPELAAKVLEYSQTGYGRFTWEQLEPEEGKYRWNIIDQAIDSWDKMGLQYAFGIAISCNTAGSEGNRQIPEWVFDAGAKYVNATSKSDSGVAFKMPVNNDPIYIEKLGNFLKALGERYDGDERIAFIDARIQGNYGEGHNGNVNNPSELVWGDEQKVLLDLYVNNFKKTQLVPTVFVDPALHEYLRKNGIGMRCDGVLDSVVEDLMMKSVYGSGPTVLEMCGGGWQNLSQDISTTGKVYWDVPMYYRSIEYTKACYLDIGEWGIGSEKYVEAEEDMIKTLANRIGYHFVLESADMPKKVMAGDRFNISMDWANKGINYLYMDARLDVALIDDEGNIVTRYMTKISPTRNWDPEETITENVSLAFSNIADGKYKLAIGLFRNDNDDVADYQIGNYDRTENGWYVIADVDKEGNVFEFSYDRDFGESDSNVEYGVIVNPSFENGNTGWILDDAFTVSKDAAISGTYSLKIDNSIAAKKAYTTFNSSNDRLYEMSFAAKADSNINYRVLTPSGKEISSGTINSSDTFKTYNVSIHYADVGAVALDAPYKLGGVRVEFETTAGGGYVYLDNLVLTDGTKLSQYYNGTNNLMRDYGMEIEYTGWYPRNKGHIERTRENSYSGDWCLKTVKTQESHGMEYDITEILKENGPGEYKFTVWAKNTTNSYAKIVVTAKGNTYPKSTGEDVENITYAEGSSRRFDTNWVQITCNFSVTQEQIDGQDRNLIEILSYNNLADFMIDETSLVKVR